MTPAERQRATLRLITFYKLLKAAAALGFAVLLWALIVLGKTDLVADQAERARHHLTAAWSLHLLSAFVSAADRHHVEFAASALTMDGAFTLLEWYALHTGRPWGEWLVVVATAALVPFEGIAIVRHRSVGRIVILVVNVAIVTFLARDAYAKHRAAKELKKAATAKAEADASMLPSASSEADPKDLA
jgi:uncharacterized membrane protein (DUF2068 family)